MRPTQLIIAGTKWPAANVIWELCQCMPLREFPQSQIRNRPHRVQETFVRRVSKIPEVRLITFRERQATVVVDRPVAQLYGRISTQLRASNRKLYFGEPMTVSVLHEIPPEQVLDLMAGPGVQYLREDLTDRK